MTHANIRREHDHRKRSSTGAIGSGRLVPRSGPEHSAGLLSLLASGLLFLLILFGLFGPLRPNLATAADLLVLDVSVLEDGSLVAVGDHGNILLRGPAPTDSWTVSSVPTDRLISAVSFTSPTVGWAVAHDALILQTTDSGRVWNLRYEDPDARAPFLDVWSSGDTRAIAVGAYGFYVETSDAGNSWEDRLVDADEPHFYSIASSSNDSLYIAGEFGTVLRSGDQGLSWTRLTTPYPGTLFGVLPIVDDTLLIYGLRGNLYRSEDAGDNWSQIDLGTTASLLTGSVGTDGRVLLAGSAGAMFESRDGGRTFVSLGRNDRLLLTGMAETSDGIWLCSEQGVFGPDGSKNVLPRAPVVIAPESDEP